MMGFRHTPPTQIERVEQELRLGHILSAVNIVKTGSFRKRDLKQLKQKVLEIVQDRSQTAYISPDPQSGYRTKYGEYIRNPAEFAESLRQIRRTFKIPRSEFQAAAKEGFDKRGVESRGLRIDIKSLKRRYDAMPV